MGNNPNTIYYIIGGVVLAIIAFIIFLKNANTKPSKVKKSGLDLEKLFDAIGGKENIQAVSANGSKITFTLSNIKNIKNEVLKEMGASGIVASKDRVTVIFGKVSEVLAAEIAQNL